MLGSWLCMVRHFLLFRPSILECFEHIFNHFCSISLYEQILRMNYWFETKVISWSGGSIALHAHDQHVDGHYRFIF